MSYTKLFSSIVTSTIWTEDAETCKVWVTMLAIANQHGEVMATIPGLAQISGLPRDAVANAIQKFLSPDPYSRTPDDEGRRIEVIEGGWALMNHGKYRAMASKEDQKAANAERQKRWREKKNRNAPVTLRNASVTDSNAQVTQDRDIAEAEADTEKENTSVTGRASQPYSPFIESLWQLFPNKSRDRSTKAKLASAWKNTKAKPPEPEVIASLVQWAKCHEWTKDGGQYAPGAHRWLKDRGWESQPESASIQTRSTNDEPKYRRNGTSTLRGLWD